MSLFENIALALSSLRAGKMRALLTMLGIIIGIGSVIAIVTVGNSLTQSITSAMDDLGVNQIQAWVTNKEANTNRDLTDDDYVTQDMIDEFQVKNQERIESILLVESAGSGQAKDGRKYANVIIYGTNESYLINSNIDIVRGHDISERDIMAGKNVTVVSHKFVDKMFPAGTNPLGQEVQVHTSSYGILTFTIVGVYKYEIPAFMSAFTVDEDIQTEMLIPLTTAKRITGTPQGFSNFTIKFKTGIDSNKFTEDITTFFSDKFKNNIYFTVQAQNMESMLNTMTTMMGTVSIAIAIIAGISLIVGGIGVMNIMLVSVTERTREIGTRKALGARSSAIRLQFIVESMIICLIGGLIGIGTGLLLGWVGSTMLGFPARPSIPVIIIAVGFSMIIGVFFGFYPANKASKLDPIEALRYE